MKEPVMMETVRLQKGDAVLLDDKDVWEIIEEDMVYEPNTQYTSDALGNISKDVKKTLRLKFYSRGAWYGYIFPWIGLCVAIRYNGFHEHIVWEKKLEPTLKVIPRDPPPTTCECAI